MINEQNLKRHAASIVLEYLERAGGPDSERTFDINGVTQAEIDQLLEMTDQMNEFRRLMVYYSCAMSEVRTKLEVLDKELSLTQKRNPFESIKSRIKTPVSIFSKMHRRNIPFSVENIEKYLNDVAGIRVICSFIDDIYMLRDCLVRQDDIHLIEEKDYIRNPKDNGYRSLHLIIEIPIFLTNEKKKVRVEVQFRTIAMDFWASLEYKMKYKKRIPDEESVSEELKYSAELINQLDRRMQQIRQKLDAAEDAGADLGSYTNSGKDEK
jgi:putative GTP pyrophosphokinase